MSPDCFLVGDIVRIRDWNDMVKEFGSHEGKYGFVHNGEPGRTYFASTEVLTRRCGDESDCEAISEFLDEM